MLIQANDKQITEALNYYRFVWLAFFCQRTNNAESVELNGKNGPGKQNTVHAISMHIAFYLYA